MVSSRINGWRWHGIEIENWRMNERYILTRIPELGDLIAAAAAGSFQGPCNACMAGTTGGSSTIGIGVVLLGRPPDGRRYPDFALVALILLASLASAYNTAIICEHVLCRKYSIFRCCVQSQASLDCWPLLFFEAASSSQYFVLLQTNHVQVHQGLLRRGRRQR